MVSKELFPQKADRLLLLYCFIAVAENLSFVQAVKTTGFTPSTISRKIARLEELLATRLFERTTRRVALTEAGRLYLEKCTQAFRSLDEADDLLEAMNNEPSGLLRLTYPSALGRLHLSEATLAFLQSYPRLRIEANYTDRYVDIIDEGYDVAIRTGQLPDSGLVTRRIANNPRLLVASPTYLELRGVPAHPHDLDDHDCLSFTRYAAGGDIWELARKDERVSVRHQARYLSDNSEAIFDAVSRGFGIAQVAAYICMDALQSGELQVVLPEWRCMPEAGIFVVFPNRTHVPPKVRSFIDFMSQRFKDAPWNFQSWLSRQDCPEPQPNSPGKRQDTIMP